MKRIVCFLLLLSLLVLPVSADSGITSAQSQSVISSNGSCQVHITFTLHLEQAPEELSFPLPPQARDITVNGAPAFSTRDEEARRISLKSVVHGPGTYTVAISYRLSDVVTADKKDNLTLTLPLLNGFAYSIDGFSFTVSLPGPVAARPNFTSTYYQETVESVMQYSFTDGVLTGSFLSRLQDHETLTMMLPVTQQMFPQSIAKRFHIDTVEIFMIFLGVIALLYWLLTLRLPIPKRQHAVTPPEGITAGELGCHLTAQGADLTLMVLSWGQMGYLLIHLEDTGRVLLHKRMEMGNERSEFENRIFRSLFGKRKLVDGSGYHYARLCRKVAAAPSPGRVNFQKQSGNPRIFRGIVGIIGALSGVSMAFAFSADTFWRVFLSILLGALGAILSWVVQGSARRIHSHDKLELWICAAGSLLWLMMSVLCGCWGTVLITLALQFLAGLAATYGGRRTQTGRHNMSQILGLRRYLKNLPSQELLRILKGNPSYFYDLSPYALALGVDKAFTQKLGDRKLVGCSWLTTGMGGSFTPKEWNQLLRDTVSSLDALQKRLPFERFMKK